MLLTLRFAGCAVSVASDEQPVCDRLARDFVYYRSGGEAGDDAITVTAELGDPDAVEVRGWYLFPKFNGRVYGWGDQRWVRYQDALVYYDGSQNRGRVISRSADLLYHYTYYLLIAKVGEALDGRGLHRLHALGVSVGGNAALLPMPISGGKTTMALALMQDPEVLLYSEDTPLIDRRGRVHPFAIRLALRESQAAGFPPGRLRIKDDPVFGVKYLLDLEHYGLHRVQGAPGEKPMILWGRKAGLAEPELRKMGALQSLGLLLLFVGTGKDCPQRAELLVRLSPGGLLTIARMVCNRCVAAIRLWRGSRSYWFDMTPEPARNAAFVKAQLRQRS